MMIRRSVRLCSLSVAAALATRPQYDADGVELPAQIGAQLAKSGILVADQLTDRPNRWFTLPQLAQCGIADAAAVEVALSHGTMRFVHAASLPLQAWEVLKTSMVKSAIDGKLLVSYQLCLAAAAAERGYKSPFWLTEKQLPAFATSIKPGEVGVAPKSSRNPSRTSCGSAVSQDTAGHFWFNAEQTMHPERFTEDNCKPMRIVSISGSPVDHVMELFVRGHIISNNLPRDTVWSSEAALRSRAGVSVLPNANPCVFAHRRELVVLFGESMTSDPALVLVSSRHPHQLKC
jgi:hypothetical protein